MIHRSLLFVWQGEDEKGESQVQETKTEKMMGKEAKPSENVIRESFEESQEHGKGGGDDEDIGVLGAIGETLAEIAQQTKELVIGEEDESFESGNVGKQGQYKHEEGSERLK